MNAMRIAQVALVVCLASGMAGAEEPAQKPRFAKPQEHPVTAQAIMQNASVQPGGTNPIGVLFDMEPGWHIYAQDPGDAGLATKIVWHAPEGAAVSPRPWPAPHEFIESGDIRTFGYSGALALISDLKAPAKAAPGTTFSVKAEVAWLACKNICLPGSAELELSVPVGNEEPVRSTHALYFDQVLD